MKRIKKLPTTGKDGRRRYRLHANLRRHNLIVDVRARTIVSRQQSDALSTRVSSWIKELNKYEYHLQLSL